MCRLELLTSMLAVLLCAEMELIYGFIGYFLGDEKSRFGAAPCTLSSEKETATSTMSVHDASISEQERKFKILTCMSTSCCEKRRTLGMDSLATFGAMYARASSTSVQVEESPCLGSCKLAPCVGVEHDDYIGCVALQGMTSDEFDAKS